MGERIGAKTADEVMDREFVAKWRDRESVGPLARRVLGRILDRFVSTGGPVEVSALAALLPEVDGAALAAAVAELDERDLILVRDGHVLVAYPFAGTPTAFAVILADGRHRHAVCAVDALGIPAMLGEPATIHARCHDCGEPLAIEVTPAGPVGADGPVVWIGERGDIRQKACSSICLTLNFFRSEEHLGRWRERHPGVPGAPVGLRDAFRIGATIFGELLPALLSAPSSPAPSAPGGSPPARP